LHSIGLKAVPVHIRQMNSDANSLSDPLVS
jgi:hypothetical protein